MYQRATLFAVIVIAIAAAAAGQSHHVKRSAKPIPSSYIVKINAGNDVVGRAHSIAARYGMTLNSVWKIGASGFSCHGTLEAAEALANDPDVLAVYEDPRLDIATTPPTTPPSSPQPTGAEPVDYNTVPDQVVSNALWHLDRLDSNGPFWDLLFRFPLAPVQRPVVYVVDGGVMSTHREFLLNGVSRVLPGFNAVTSDLQTDPDGTNPCFSSFGSHGTAVASLVAGNWVGVAKTAVDIVPVKIYDCSGAGGGALVIDGLEWILDADRNPYYGRPGIVNWSGSLPIPTGDSQEPRTLWEEKLDNIGGSLYKVNGTTDGIAVVVAANNRNTWLADLHDPSLAVGDACNTSPARHSRTNPVTSLQGSVITVGGADQAPTELTSSGNTETPTKDRRYVPGGIEDSQYTSNWGLCVTLFAPGAHLWVASNESPLDYRESLNSGTSFAAPIVSGIAARYVAEHPEANPDEVHQYLTEGAASGEMDPLTLNPSGQTGSWNRLARIAADKFGNPKILTQPQSQELLAGQCSALEVVLAAGDPTSYAYNWYSGNRGDTTAAVNQAQCKPPYTAQCCVQNPGTYWARVTTDVGTLDSTAAEVVECDFIPDVLLTRTSIKDSCVSGATAVAIVNNVDISTSWEWWLWNGRQPVESNSQLLTTGKTHTFTAGTPGWIRPWAKVTAARAGCVARTLSTAPKAILVSGNDRTLCGDINGNGQVTLADFFAWINAWYVIGGYVPETDLDINGDTNVTVDDREYLFNYVWNSGPTPKCTACS